MTTHFSVSKSFLQAFEGAEEASLEDQPLLTWKELNLGGPIGSKIRAARPEDPDDVQQLKRIDKTVYQRIAHIALVVQEYDEAIEFYTQKLDFTLLEDKKIDEKKRWVMVAPPGAKECGLLLAKADSEQQSESIGNQTGGRVGFFLFTDDFWRDYHKMEERKISFIRPPSEVEYGTVAVFEDLYGNLWDLIEPNENNKGLIKKQ